MNCQNHPEIPATAYCRSCGKPVCEQCRRDAFGTVFCAEHAPAPASAAGPSSTAMPPYSGPTGPGAPMTMPPSSYALSNVSPPLAFFLGLIPGVGAIYNGQYAKGLVHALIVGLMISILNSSAVRGMEPIFAILLMVWWFYMAMEAYHTARKRQAGEPVDEYSSLIDFRNHKGQVPVAGIALIVLGVLLLLHTLDFLNFEYMVRYWPALLIVAGVYLLWGRFFGEPAAEAEMRHERQ
jgi:TM2 domain-containing membrane protein YozV